MRGMRTNSRDLSRLIADTRSILDPTRETLRFFSAVLVRPAGWKSHFQVIIVEKPVVTSRIDFYFSGRPVDLKTNTRRNDIAGTQVLFGAGVPFGRKYPGEKHCTFTLYVDASNQGQVFETFDIVHSTYSC